MLMESVKLAGKRRPVLMTLGVMQLNTVSLAKVHDSDNLTSGCATMLYLILMESAGKNFYPMRLSGVRVGMDCMLPLLVVTSSKENRAESYNRNLTNELCMSVYAWSTASLVYSGASAR